MSSKDFCVAFCPILPRLRSRKEILTDLEISSENVSSVAGHHIGDIEIHIKNGQTFYQLGGYNHALEEFSRARALIFKIIHPDFDVEYYLKGRHASLPVSNIIERELLEDSIHLAELIRPTYVKSRLVIPNRHDIIPDNLKQYIIGGFHESVGGEDILQFASVLARAGGFAREMGRLCCSVKRKQAENQMV
jgi:hypothetical protein